MDCECLEAKPSSSCFVFPASNSGMICGDAQALSVEYLMAHVRWVLRDIFDFAFDDIMITISFIFFVDP